jgi:hypothetical protein
MNDNSKTWLAGHMPLPGQRVTIDGYRGGPCWLALWALPPGSRTISGCPDSTCDLDSFQQGVALLEEAGLPVR